MYRGARCSVHGSEAQGGGEPRQRRAAVRPARWRLGSGWTEPRPMLQPAVERTSDAVTGHVGRPSASTSGGGSSSSLRQACTAGGGPGRRVRRYTSTAPAGALTCPLQCLGRAQSAGSPAPAPSHPAAPPRAARKQLPAGRAPKVVSVLVGQQHALDGIAGRHASGHLAQTCLLVGLQRQGRVEQWVGGAVGRRRQRREAGRHAAGNGGRRAPAQDKARQADRRQASCSRRLPSGSCCTAVRTQRASDGCQAHLRLARSRFRVVLLLLRRRIGGHLVEDAFKHAVRHGCCCTWCSCCCSVHQCRCRGRLPAAGS